uniref:Uncharacterized protein n=1 Tax=Plectus sambesii TaxID=2011161 RepID=A0A914WAU2_9BILA
MSLNFDQQQPDSPTGDGRAQLQLHEDGTDYGESSRSSDQSWPTSSSPPLIPPSIELRFVCEYCLKEIVTRQWSSPADRNRHVCAGLFKCTPDVQRPRGT